MKHTPLLIGIIIVLLVGAAAAATVTTVPASGDITSTTNLRGGQRIPCGPVR